MKAYTSIKQSRHLLEIGIPAESADLCWGIDFETNNYNNSPYPCPWKDYTCKEVYLPCWSLAALLGLIDSPTLSKDKLGIGEVGWMVSSYPNNCRYDSLWHDNPIDACIEMILKLKENKYI